MSEYLGHRLDPQVAIEWIRSSLSHGFIHGISEAQALEHSNVAYLIVPDAFTLAAVGQLDDAGRGISTSEVDKIAGRLLDKFALEGVRSLIVEDDLARRGDLILGADVAYVADRVIRWTDLDNGPADGVRLLRRGASGYPLNAYFSWLTPDQLSLMSGREVKSNDIELLVSSICALVTSVFDAEAYVALILPELADCFA